MKKPTKKLLFIVTSQGVTKVWQHYVVAGQVNKRCIADFNTPEEARLQFPTAVLW